MIDSAAINPESINELNLPIDLRREALDAIQRGDPVETYEGEWNGHRVVTLVVDGRAGQACNGDAHWGDWDAERRVVELDSGEAVDLNGDVLDVA